MTSTRSFRSTPLKQRFDVVGSQPHAPMASIAIYATRVISTVNPYHGSTEADPVLPEWIVRSWFDLIHHLLSLCLFFCAESTMARAKWVFAHPDHHQRADRSLPLLAGLPNCNRICAPQFLAFKMNQHSLKHIDLYGIRFLDRHDMTVVYVNSVACIETVANLLAVAS